MMNKTKTLVTVSTNYGFALMFISIVNTKNGIVPPLSQIPGSIPTIPQFIWPCLHLGTYLYLRPSPVPNKLISFTVCRAVPGSKSNL